MNAVEIESAVSDLFQQPFDPAEFPFALLAAFGNKGTTLAKLRKGVSNASDVPNGVLQRNNIHIAVAPTGEVSETLSALRESPKTAQAKAKFVLATDGETLEAEELSSGETIASEYAKFAEHFGFFLPLAGITTVKEIKDNPIDVRATGRLNKLYIELLKENPDWATEARRPDLNHFLARLIFCFFAEDTDIFLGSGLFTKTIDQMSERDGGNTHAVLEQIFRAMNVKPTERKAANLPNYADQFPYVNGGLFSGSAATPMFSKIARSYLIRAGELNWRKINPDIFGSMIQAVADDEERGSLGMHYTSVPNILKVLNPLFLDDLREQLERAGDHKASLLKLRERMSKIRVFDPACGSGNFLVIAYKEMRAIEGEINRRRKEPDHPSTIPTRNFCGIEIRSFAAEIARLALIIAEFQCDVLYRGPKLALAEFLPLNAENWIVCGNALRLDWTTVCPPSGTGVSIVSTSNDLFETPLEQPKIHFNNEGGETYICGNPPYKGGKKQNRLEKLDMEAVAGRRYNPSNLDYVCAFFSKAIDMLSLSVKAAFVTTNSINQGTHVPNFWKFALQQGISIQFAYEPFKWANNAASNAGVSCTIIGLCDRELSTPKIIYSRTDRRQVESINAYLIPGSDLIVESKLRPESQLSLMNTGNQPADGGFLCLSKNEVLTLLSDFPSVQRLLRPLKGSAELFSGTTRWCLWIGDEDLEFANSIPVVRERIEAVRSFREQAGEVAQTLTGRPHQFRYRNLTHRMGLLVPCVSSELREYIPATIFGPELVVTHAAHAIFDAKLLDFSFFMSKLHYVWARTLSGRLKTDFRYSSNLCWNTFPVPTLTEQNKDDLTRCAEEILLARERNFPKTIADLYDPEEMPDDLRRAHERNDETLERIYIGRRFKNDTERLEKLFELYAKMTEAESGKTRAKKT